MTNIQDWVSRYFNLLLKIWKVIGEWQVFTATLEGQRKCVNVQEEWQHQLWSQALSRQSSVGSEVREAERTLLPHQTSFNLDQ